MAIRDDTTWRTLLAGIAASAVMTVLGVGFLVGLTWGLDRLFSDLVAAAILAAAAPIITSISLGIWSSYRERSAQIQLDRQERRGEAYELFLDYLFDAIAQLDDPQKSDEYELEADRYARFVRDLLIWGSDDLIERWNKFRRIDFEDLDLDEQREWYGRLLEQVHHELRGSDTSLSWQELYRLYSMETNGNGNDL